MTQSNPTIGDLKACPFCGTKAKFYGGQSGSGEARGVICYNPTCGCVMNAKEQKLTPVDVIATAWNTRPQSSDAVGVEKSLRHRLQKSTELLNVLAASLRGQSQENASRIANECIEWNCKALAQPPSDASGWRDIGSAPKDGTKVWIWYEVGGKYPCADKMIAYWSKPSRMSQKSAGWYEATQSNRLDSILPDADATHWQPLPSTPPSGGER